MTTTYKFQNVLFDFGQLLATMSASKISKAVWAQAAEAGRPLWKQELETSAELQEVLVHGLKRLTDGLIADLGVSDKLVVMARRISANSFRLMGRYAEAEAMQRLEPKESLLTLAILAEDILAQKRPNRRAEVVGLYRDALELGFIDLPHTIWPSQVRAEIGEVYVSLARVLIDIGVIEEAMAAIKDLMDFNDKSVTQINRSAALTIATFDAYKLMLDLSCGQAREGNVLASSRALSLASRLAFSMLILDAWAAKVKAEAQQLFQHTCATLDLIDATRMSTGAAGDDHVTEGGA